MNGLIDGFMWGGITAGVSNVIKPGSFCFIAGTKVLTDSGQKNIEDIEVGDQVLAYDEETGVTAYKPVLHLFRNTTKEWCTVSIRGAEGELYEITSTPGHKYFVPGNRVRKDSRAPEHASYAGLSEKWVSACDLKHGDKVLLSDGTLCEVEGVSCKKLSEPETTYNLEVADFHTYYVSDACVLVHNANCGRWMEELSDDQLRSFGRAGKNSGFRVVDGSHNNAMQFVKSQVTGLKEFKPGKFVGYNSRRVEFRVYANYLNNYTSIRINGVMGLKGIKFLWG